MNPEPPSLNAADALIAPIIEALQDIKGKDIEILSVTTLTSLFDTLILVSADSTRQTRALAHNLEDQLRRAGYNIVGIEGRQTGEWILVDLGAVIVHIMQPSVRTYYDLASLWTTPGGVRAIPNISRPLPH